MSTVPIEIGNTMRPMPTRLIRLGWIVLLLGVALSGCAYLTDGRRASFDSVILVLFLGSLVAGAIFLVALEYISGAVWSVPMRRVSEFLAGLALLLPVAGILPLIHLQDLFPWAASGTLAGDHLMQVKSPYLNPSFFITRFVVICALWILFYWLFTHNSRRQDETHEQKLTTRNIRLSALFIPLFAFAVSATAIDWGMSLEPHWYSTIFGVYYFSGTVLAALAAVTLVVVLLLEGNYLPKLHRDHLYSLGALMFAFVNFWAYIAFSQFLLIWYANLPEETAWFITRWHNGWEIVSILLIVVHFAVPYFVLLPQDAKMDPKRLKFMAIWILVAHLVDLYWLVMPSYAESVSLGWTELSVPLIITGAGLLVFSWNMGRHNIIPVGDPKLERALNFHL